MTNLSDSSLKTSCKVGTPGFMKRTGCFIKVLVLVFAASWATAQVGLGASAQVLITQPIDEGRLITLKSNTRPEATAANDRGAVGDQFPIEHMLLHLRRSPARERALQTFIAGLHTPGSPNFHRWITAQEFGDRFGLAKPDLATLTYWMQSHGFKVNVVYPNGLMIDFSGTAGQVREAFRTEIHRLEVDGRTHIANMSDPQIPSALAPAVAGIVSLHDFMPRTMYQMRSDFTFSTSNGTFEGVVPADLATIYNLNPLFNSGTSGQGQTIVVIEDTDVYVTSNTSPDWATFRSTFGLSGYAGQFTQINPQPPAGGTNCSDPGVNGNDIEALLDAEYASAAAPSATIELASCSDSGVTFGGLIALQNLLNQSGTPPAIVSISYGECESTNGAAANLAYSSTYAQAVAEGVSVFVSSGDEGAAGCDPRSSIALHGIGVSGFASTPYNVAVGGTDFGDTYAGTTSTYWNSTNTPTYGSARSYVPEIPWNDSCASVLIANFENFSTTYGASGFCNSSTGASFLTTAAGSGGPSGCATGAANTPGLVNGTCAGWSKPAWQAVVGNPADGVRDLPDVSLFAANGVWGHYYVFCDSDISNGGTPCTGNPSTWSGAGGTSFAAPIVAGIQALVNQKTGSSQGNPNPTYYSLAAAEYSAGGSASCNSTMGGAAANSCIFYDVTQGDMDLACYPGSFNCYQPSPGASYGVLSTSNSSYSPAYGTTTGWDFATGLGTLNAANLVNNWPTGTTPNFSFSPSPNNLTIAQTGSGATAITITPTNGFAGSVNLWVSGLPNGVTASFDQNPATTTANLTLTASGTAPIGTVTLTIFGSSGSLSHTATMSLSVVPAFTLSASPSSLSITQGASGGTSTITIAPANGFSGAVNFSATGLPSGVSASFSPNPATGTASTLTLTAAYGATIGTSTVTIVGTYGAATQATTISVTVVASPPPNFSLSASPNNLMITQGGASGSTVINIASLFSFSGNVTLAATGLPNRVTASFSPNPTAVTGSGGSSTLTLTAGSTATVGTVTITITGTSGGLTSSTPVMLNVSAGTPANPLSFQTPVTYLVDSGPTAVAVGDFNQDGNPDLVVANGASSNVSVLLGNGDGTFQSALNSSVGNSPTAVAVGNFNGDSHPDLVVANGTDNTIIVLLGNGDGTFATATNSPISVGKSPTGVAVGDFNGDGNLDLVVANGGDNTVSVLLGHGDGTFAATANSPFPVGNSPTAVAVGDFNGDGNLDLVVANASDNTVSVLLGHGDGTFTPAVSYAVGTGPTAIAVGDGDVDGIADIVVANGGSNNLSVLVGNGDGTFKAAVSYPVGPSPASPTAVAVGDFNGDGKQDVAVANAGSNTVSILLGNGDCTFQAPTTLSVGNNPLSLAVGDFNQDVRPDLAVADQGDNNVSILLNSTGIQALAITSGNRTIFTVGAAGAFTVTASGFPTITGAGQLPNLVTLNDNRNGTALLGGIPAQGTGGVYAITLTAKNGQGSATQNFTLQVNQAAAITTANATTFMAGSPGSFTVIASGYPAPVLTESGVLPSGVTFNSGILSGTPAPGTGGTYSIIFTAHNSVGPDATQIFTLTVDQATAFTSASAATFLAGTSSAFTVTTLGFPPASLNVLPPGPPAGVTFTDNGNGTGTLSVLTTAATGVFNLTFTANNGIGVGATQNFTLTIGTSQTITFTIGAPPTAAYGSNFTVVATGGSSGNPVIFSSSGVCSNVGATYTMTSGTGTCSVIANQAGANGYLPASQITQATTATLAVNTITFTTPPPAQAAYLTSFTVVATGNSSNPVVYESYGSCRNSGATYTMYYGSGPCLVTAIQFNDTNYASASASETTTAIPASQTITFTTNAPASAAYGSTFTVVANASSGLAITYTSSGACSNSGIAYTMTSGTGTCSVIANQAGSGPPYHLYAAAPTVTEMTAATPVAQTITFTTRAPASAVYGASFTVAATASSGLPVTYASSGPCTNVGAVYTMTGGIGTCSVIASQPGNSNYSAANSVSENTTATQASQHITFTMNAPSSAVYGTGFNVAANASSGLPITYTSSGACSNAGAAYTMTGGTGTCSVIANQSGNGNYSAARQVTQSTTAVKAAATVSITNIPANAVAGKSFSPTYTTNSNGATSVTSNTTTICTVSANTVSFKAAGTCTLVAHTASTSNYNAGTGTSQSFTIIAITLASISPTSGVRGTSFQVQLTGTNLNGATAVAVSGTGITVSNISSTASTVTATFTIASNATVSTRTVSVTTSIGSSNTVNFTVSGPTLTSISPTTGTHGTTVPVTLSGTNLTGATAISVSGGGIQVTGLQVVNSTQITANFVIASGATLSSRSVSVTTPIGTTTGNVTFAVK